MTHHRHFVQGGLSVKDDDVPVAHVPLHLTRHQSHQEFIRIKKKKKKTVKKKKLELHYLIADLKVKVTRFRVEPKVNSVSVIADDVFGSGILTVSSPHQLLESEKGIKGNQLKQAISNCITDLPTRFSLNHLS